MADSKDEVLRYSMDITDAEVKADRLKQLLEEVKAKRAAGEDVSELEAQVNKELDGLGRLANQEKRTSSETEELLKQKEKLGAAMRVVGSQASGLAADLGGVLELLMQGGKQAVIFGGALAAVSVGITLYQKLKESIHEAVEAQERLNQKVLEGKQGAVERGGALADRMLALGGMDRFDDASRMAQSLQKQYGFTAEQAAAVAGVGTMAGLTVEQAGMLHVAMQRGAKAETPEQVAAMFGAMGEGTGAGLRGQLHGLAGTQMYQLRARLAQAPGAMAARARYREIEALFVELQQTGQLPEGVESVGDLAELLEKTERAVGVAAGTETPRGGFGKDTVFARAAARTTSGQRELAPAERFLGLATGRGAAGGAAPVDVEWAPEVGGGTPAVQQFIVNHNVRIGTQFNTRDKRVGPVRNPADLVGVAAGKNRGPLDY